MIPAAGLGSRFLPATKAIPKEMLPIVDKPTIQYVVEEAVSSGLEDIILVTSQGKEAIENHFDYSAELEAALKGKKGKEELWKMVETISNMITVSSVRQKKPMGLGHAVLVTEPFVGDEPFGVFLGDDIIRADIPCMKQLLDVFEFCGGSVIAVMEVPPQVVSRYGIVSVEELESDFDQRIYSVRDMIEKPSPEEAPSNLGIIGRYLLTPGVFPALHQTTPGALGEIQLTDGLRRLMEQEPVFACRFDGVRYDAGNKLEYLQASIEFGLNHSEIGFDLREYLRNLDL